MGGAGGATNPEQLFAVGYAARVHTALKLIAGRDKLDASGSEVSATVGIGTLDNGGFGLEVDLDVSIRRSIARQRSNWSLRHTRCAHPAMRRAATSPSPSRARLMRRDIG